MRARCYGSLLWCGPCLLGALLVLAGGQKAAASDLTSWLQEVNCADGASALDFAALEEAQATAAPAQPDQAKAAGKACKTNGQCPKKDYCAKAVGDCLGKGNCTVKPQICTDIFKPVCGCNGKTFANDCWAAAAGVNVKSEGACVTAKAAACKTNAQCPAGDFCAKPTGKCDDEGICARRPTICSDIVDPVCGCNKKTFNNMCESFRAGVDVLHTGKC